MSNKYLEKIAGKVVKFPGKKVAPKRNPININDKELMMKHPILRNKEFRKSLEEGPSWAKRKPGEKIPSLNDLLE